MSPRAFPSPLSLWNNSVVHECMPHLYLHTLLWAVACVAFFGCLRLREITATANPIQPSLLMGSLLTPTLYRQLFSSLGHTKTNPLGRGVIMYLGKMDSTLCQVRALLHYLAVCPGPRNGPLFILEDGHHLPRDLFVVQVRAVLAAAGVDQSRYKPQSLTI